MTEHAVAEHGESTVRHVSNPLLEMHSIEKRFGSTRALRGVDLDVGVGSIHGLVGQNGAGKSTLMKILSGVHTADRGNIRIAGRNVAFGSPVDARDAGIAMVYQEFSLIPSLTVAQNVYLNREESALAGYINDRECERRVAEIFRRLHVRIDPRRRVESLSVGDRQLTEIAKALSHDGRILVLDEPTASLSRKEADALFVVLRNLASSGLGIILITHHLQEVLANCDFVTVLRDGQVVLRSDVNAQNIGSLVSAMLGGSMPTAPQRAGGASNDGNDVALDVKGVSDGTGLLKGVTFVLRRGEILGVAGLLGSGRTELLEAIAGVRDFTGSIRLPGAAGVRRRRSQSRDGVALVPDDRQTKGLILDFSLAENIALPILGLLRRGLVFDDRRAHEIARAFIEKMNIVAPSADVSALTLSGGNQQKVVLAKAFATDASVLIMDEPTFGVDMGAAHDIATFVRSFADDGGAVLWASSELDELLRVSDRILVLREGSVGAVLTNDAALDEEALLNAIQ